MFEHAHAHDAIDRLIWNVCFVQIALLERNISAEDGVDLTYVLWCRRPFPRKEFVTRINVYDFAAGASQSELKPGETSANFEYLQAGLGRDSLKCPRVFEG